MRIIGRERIESRCVGLLIALQKARSRVGSDRRSISNLCSEGGNGVERENRIRNDSTASERKRKAKKKT